MEPIDYDGAWKEALELFLRPLLVRCFPRVAEGIDWRRDCEFMDKELQEVVRDAELGKQRADKLIKVYRREGGTQWLLIHIEVQGQVDKNLPLRIYQYQHRIADRFGCRVIGLAILGDLDGNWRPSVYNEELWGCCLRYEYLVCKLLDFVADDLEKNPDPAAVIISAHLAAQKTAGNMPERHRFKWALTRRLYEHGYNKDSILELYRVLDWLLVLPEELGIAFKRDLIEYEEEKHMRHITSIERLGREEERLLILREGITDILDARFGEVPFAIKDHLVTIQDPNELKRLHRCAAIAPNLESFQTQLRN